MALTAGRVVDHAAHAGTFIAHFDQDGRLLLLEVLDASNMLASMVKATRARGPRGVADQRV